MNKAISLCLAILMIACTFVGCHHDEQKESEPQAVRIFELENEKIIAENVSPDEGVYAVRFTNTGDKTIQDAQLVFGDGTQELMFWFEILPAGQTITVTEQDELRVAAEELKYIDSSISYLADGIENPGSVEVTGGEEGLIQVKNITGEVLPLVRVFYRQTDDSGNMIGGSCCSVLADGIAPGETVQVMADGWNDRSAVVTVLVVSQ